MRRLAFWLLVMLVACPAIASIPKLTTGYTYGSGRPVYATQQQACDAFAIEARTTYNLPTLIGQLWNGDFGCKAVHPASGNTFGSVNLTAVSNVCPANSTSSGAACSCNAGFDESGGQCVPHVNACTAKAGQVQITNFTVGYSRTPDAGDTAVVGQPNKLPSSGKLCSGGCEVSIPDAGAPGWKAWQSQEPSAQGLYRWSLDIPSVVSGTECTPGVADAALDPSAVATPCPGAIGEVNGKLGCYGTASAPVVTQDAGRPPVPKEAGNPPAGPKPLTGEGSGEGSTGRTPSAGNGTGTGGPASAGVGGKGNGSGGSPSSGSSGTVNAPGEGKEQAECGAPGQPRCAIDETGTPAGGNSDADKKALDSAWDSALTELQKAAGAEGVDTKWGFIPSWFNSASCTPWNLGTLPVINRAITVDVCPIMPYALGVTTFLWVVGTFFAIVGMVGRVMGPGVS